MGFNGSSLTKSKPVLRCYSYYVRLILPPIVQSPTFLNIRCLANKKDLTKIYAFFIAGLFDAPLQFVCAMSTR